MLGDDSYDENLSVVQQDGRGKKVFTRKIEVFAKRIWKGSQ